MPAAVWAPDLPPDGPPWETEILISDHAKAVQSLSFDELDRLVEWAVIQMRYVDDRWQRVAVYDMCHGKGVHLHLFDRRERKFTQVLGLEGGPQAIRSYDDVGAGLDYALDRVTKHWDENERRSDRGR